MCGFVTGRMVENKREEAQGMEIKSIYEGSQATIGHILIFLVVRT